MTVSFFLDQGESAFDRRIGIDPELARAYAYADAAHSALNQRRKFTGRPYIEHPRMVAAILMHSIPDDIAALSAALLHDVVEDTDVTLDDLLRHFSGDVVDLVDELTEPDNPDYYLAFGHATRPNRAIRRQLEAERRAEISKTAQTISVADIIANSHDIADVAPSEFALMYQGELMQRLILLQQADPKLVSVAHQLLTDNLSRLGAKR